MADDERAAKAARAKAMVSLLSCTVPSTRSGCMTDTTHETLPAQEKAAAEEISRTYCGVGTQYTKLPSFKSSISGTFPESDGK